jgi:hypothetical protein
MDYGGISKWLSEVVGNKSGLIGTATGLVISVCVTRVYSWAVFQGCFADGIRQFNYEFFASFAPRRDNF